jgi:hypothetical protein
MKHTKRYMVIFEKWGRIEFHEDKTEFDTLTEAMEEAQLLEEFYTDTPSPKKLKRYDYHSGRNTIYHEWGEPYLDEYLWGYAILDFDEEKVIKWGHDQLKYVSKNEDIRKIKDRFFRKDGEVPEGYKWDVGEYEGWLQFRWGNGRNSVEFGEDAVIDSKDNAQKCVRRCSIKKKKYHNFTYDESEELELDKLNEEILAESKVSVDGN